MTRTGGLAMCRWLVAYELDRDAGVPWPELKARLWRGE
jgi:hypothetical protein